MKVNSPFKLADTKLLLNYRQRYKFNKTTRDLTLTAPSVRQQQHTLKKRLRDVDPANKAAVLSPGAVSVQEQAVCLLA